MSFTLFFFPSFHCVWSCRVFIICIHLFRAPNATVMFQSVNRTLYRDRLVNMPHNAQDVPSIVVAYSKQDIVSKFGTTASGHSFFKTAYECAEFSYCIFASDEIIKMFQEGIPQDRRKFAMDATFKICPFGVFKQILIIYVSYLDAVNIFFSSFSHLLAHSCVVCGYIYSISYHLFSC